MSHCEIVDLVYFGFGPIDGLNVLQRPILRAGDRLVFHVRSDAPLDGQIGWAPSRNGLIGDAASPIGILLGRIDVPAPLPDGFHSYSLAAVNEVAIRAPAYVGRVPDLIVDLRASAVSANQLACVEIWRDGER